MFRGTLADLNILNPLEGVLYRGTVVDIADPLGRGRVRLRIFGIHTPQLEKKDYEGIPDNELPWAEQVAPCLGGSSGAGFFAVPIPGTIVWCFFDQGDPLHPAYFGVQFGAGGGGAGSGSAGTANAATGGENVTIEAEEIPIYNGSDGLKFRADGSWRLDLATAKDLHYVKPQAGVDLSGLRPEVLLNLINLCKEYNALTGSDVSVSSAYRSYEKQEEVRRQYGSGAARPGGSTHGVGTAIDLSSSRMNSYEVAIKKAGIDMDTFVGKFGFTRTLLHASYPENWHLEAKGFYTTDMQADRNNKIAGRKVGGQYMTDAQKEPFLPDELKTTSENSKIT